MSGLSPAAILYDSSGNPVAVLNDGGVYRLQQVGKLLDSGGTQINPAKEDGNLASIKGKTDNIPSDPAREGGNLATLAAVDFATQTTLATRASETTLQAADTKLGTIDGVLDAIKDTDGIKKIVDALPAGTNNIGDVDIASALPAGTNEIGKVAQGTKAAGSGAWPEVLYDASGNAVGVVLDGAVYRLQTQTKIVRASDGAQINPATQETLAAIKDTDGVKKITDQLPAGTNEIGAVKQGTRATAAGGWPQYVVDSSGNVVGVVSDDGTYRLQMAGKVAKEVTGGGLVHLDAIPTVTGRGRLKSTLYTPDGDPVAFGAISSSIKNDFVRSGGLDSLLVNGSVTPVVFTYDADSTYDISIQEIKFTLSANSITFGTNHFGAVSGPLTNGLLIEAVIASGTVTLFNLQQNESFVNFSSPGGFEWVVSSKDMMTANYLIGGGLKLRHGTSDKIQVTVRDNISSAGNYLKCFVKGNLLMNV